MATHCLNCVACSVASPNDWRDFSQEENLGATMKTFFQNKSNWLLINAVVLIIIGIIAQILLGPTSIFGFVFFGLAAGIFIGSFMTKSIR